MQRCHYRELAAAISRSCTTLEQREWMANVLATELAKDNPKFQPAKFIAACR